MPVDNTTFEQLKEAAKKSGYNFNAEQTHEAANYLEGNKGNIDQTVKQYAQIYSL
ncbi:MAG: hypothetical protein WBK77_08990 [Alphaproteobacteria bacterium]